MIGSWSDTRKRSGAYRLADLAGGLEVGVVVEDRRLVALMCHSTTPATWSIALGGAERVVEVAPLAVEDVGVGVVDERRRRGSCSRRRSRTVDRVLDARTS